MSDPDNNGDIIEALPGPLLDTTPGAFYIKSYAAIRILRARGSICSAHLAYTYM